MSIPLENIYIPAMLQDIEIICLEIKQFVRFHFGIIYHHIILDTYILILCLLKKYFPFHRLIHFKHSIKRYDHIIANICTFWKTLKFCSRIVLLINWHIFEQKVLKEYLFFTHLEKAPHTCIDFDCLQNKVAKLLCQFKKFLII